MSADPKDAKREPAEPAAEPARPRRIPSLEFHAPELRLPGVSEPPSEEHVIADAASADFFSSLPSHDAWASTDVFRVRSRSEPSTRAPRDPQSATETIESSEITRVDALQLVARASTRPPRGSLDLNCELEERFQLGDFSEALRIGELLLGLDPEHAGARARVEEARVQLRGLYLTKLGGTKTVLAHASNESDVKWLGLDHRAGFVLAQVDGAMAVEELLMVTNLPELETLRVLVELLQSGVVAAKSVGSASPR